MLAIRRFRKSALSRLPMDIVRIIAAFVVQQVSPRRLRLVAVVTPININADDPTAPAAAAKKTQATLMAPAANVRAAR